MQKNTVEKRLLNARGLPNFGLNFYIVNAKGEYAGVSMYAEHVRGVHGEGAGDPADDGPVGGKDDRLTRPVAAARFHVPRSSFLVRPSVRSASCGPACFVRRPAGGVLRAACGVRRAMDPASHSE